MQLPETDHLIDRRGLLTLGAVSMLPGALRAEEQYRTMTQQQLIAIIEDGAVFLNPPRLQKIKEEILRLECLKSREQQIHDLESRFFALREAARTALDQELSTIITETKRPLDQHVLDQITPSNAHPLESRLSLGALHRRMIHLGDQTHWLATTNAVEQGVYQQGKTLDGFLVDVRHATGNIVDPSPLTDPQRASVVRNVAGQANKDFWDVILDTKINGGTMLRPTSTRHGRVLVIERDKDTTVPEDTDGPFYAAITRNVATPKGGSKAQCIILSEPKNHIVSWRNPQATTHTASNMTTKHAISRQVAPGGSIIYLNYANANVSGITADTNLKIWLQISPNTFHEHAALQKPVRFTSGDHNLHYTATTTDAAGITTVSASAYSLASYTYDTSVLKNRFNCIAHRDDGSIIPPHGLGEIKRFAGRAADLEWQFRERPSSLTFCIPRDLTMSKQVEFDLKGIPMVPGKKEN